MRTDIIVEKWDQLAEFLISYKLKNLDASTFPARVDLPYPIRLPIYERSVSVEYVMVERRYSTRKLPHLVNLVSEKGEEKRYVFKENDNMAMDAAIMALLVRANQIWRLRQCPAWTRTYDVVATADSSGFCELIPGFTLLSVSNEEILGLLGYSSTHWERFYHSMIGAMVVTAAFDITDRHENNMLFVPDGDVALIDLSCSLGNRNPLDVMMHINPVYFPLRLRRVFETYQEATKERVVSEKIGSKTWNQVEEDAMMSYYALFNDSELSDLLRKADYRMPTPMNFLKAYHNRRFTTKERCEKMRNGICKSMEDSERVTKVISTLAKTLPG